MGGRNNVLDVAFYTKGAFTPGATGVLTGQHNLATFPAVHTYVANSLRVDVDLLRQDPNSGRLYRSTESNFVMKGIVLRPGVAPTSAENGDVRTVAALPR